MAGTIVVDRIESDASYASTINVAGQITFSNTVNFGATAQRITGDFSNATLANRVAFQSSTTNGATVVTAIPNGNSTQSFFAVHNSSDITNSSLGYIAATGLDTRIVSASTGTGTNLPLTFFTGGSERMRVDTSGNVGIGTQANPTLGMVEIKHTAGASPFYVNSTATAVNARITLNTTSNTSSVSYVLSNNNAGVNKQASFYLVSSNGGLQFQTGQTAGAEPTTGTACFRMQDDFVGVINPTTRLGYDTGAGGTVTQATSKSTAVTLNKPTGQITMNNAALAAGASAQFIVNNTLVTTSDTVVLTPSNNANYTAICTATTAGSFYVRVTNITGGSLSEALVISFAIIKGATS